MGIQGLGVPFAARADDPASPVPRRPVTRSLGRAGRVLTARYSHDRLGYRACQRDDRGFALARAGHFSPRYPGTLCPATCRILWRSGQQLDPPRTAVQHKLAPERPVRRFSNIFLAGNDGIMDVFISEWSVTENCPAALRGTHLDANAWQHFRCSSEKSFSFARGSIHPEIVAQAEPDVVLTQNVERYLISTPSDVLQTQRPPLPGIGWAAPRSLRSSSRSSLTRSWRTDSIRVGWRGCWSVSRPAGRPRRAAH